jgi:DNA-binding transcriptional regulator YhcF (GntR family)
MKNNHKIIKILDLDRWGIKHGQKRQWYYKMRLDFFNDPTIQALDNITKIVFLALISESLRENKQQISMCLEFIKHQLRVDLDVVKLSLRELKDNNIIELKTNVRTQLIEEKRREENKTEQQNKSTELIDDILDIWNRNAPDYNLPSVKVLNDTRKKKLQLALKDFKEVEDWRKIFSVASQKGFTSKDGKKFIPSWDYVFRNNNYATFYDEYEILFSEKLEYGEKLEARIESDLINSLMV